jgi:hypothetical protein
MEKYMFLFALGGISIIALVCGLIFGVKNGALVIGLLLLISFGISIAVAGSGVILIAAYVGGFVLFAAGVGLGLGVAIGSKL